LWGAAVTAIGDWWDSNGNCGAISSVS
jgi:hypothetical protein